MANLLNEPRMFSDSLTNAKISDKLFASSVSKEDARIRQNEYQKIFSRYNEMKKEYQKLFSGYAETPLLSTQYFNATVAAYVSSFAGFMSIERDMDQPNGLFYWMDVLGVSDGREVMPNIGADNFTDISVMGRLSGEPAVASGTAKQSFMIGKKIMPGSLKVRIIRQDGSENVLIDNGKGMLIAEAGVLKAMVGGKANINYMSGNVEFECGSNLQDGQDKIVYLCAEDSVGEPSLQEANPAYTGPAYNKNRFVAKLRQIPMGTVPDMLTAEYNISALAAMKKATNTDIASFMFSKLRDLYSKLINFRLVKTLEAGYTGTTTVVDLTKNGFHDYRSNLDLFAANMINVESQLAAKAVKGVTTTAYVVGVSAANMFQKCATIGKFERNEKTSYITDLLGWYDGVPVLRSNDLPTDMGYAIHKTADGQLAPLARGIYLPLRA